MPTLLQSGQVMPTLLQSGQGPCLLLYICILASACGLGISNGTMEPISGNDGPRC